VSSPASNASWSELNAFYEANAAASLQAVHDAYADVALLSPPNSPDFIFPGTAPDYIYNPYLTAEERNATPPHSPIPYALLELAEEALRRQQLDEEDESPLPTLQYPSLEAFVPDEEIPVEELPPLSPSSPPQYQKAPSFTKDLPPPYSPSSSPLSYDRTNASTSRLSSPPTTRRTYTPTSSAPRPAPRTPAITPTSTPSLFRTVRTFGLRKRSSPTETSYVSSPTAKTSLRHSPISSPLSGLKSYIQSLSPPDRRLPWWRAWSNELREEMHWRRRNRRVPPEQVDKLPSSWTVTLIAASSVRAP
jgi:hypothetical protein